MNRKELLALYTHFQYPQPDRSLCNVDKCHIAAHLEEILSVSSAGSKPLQSPSLLPAQVSPRRKTFSILSRIEASAILVAFAPSSMRKIFQYPQPDRSLCNRRYASGGKGVVGPLYLARPFPGPLSASIFRAFAFCSIHKTGLFRKSVFAKK